MRRIGLATLGLVAGLLLAELGARLLGAGLPGGGPAPLEPPRVEPAGFSPFIQRDGMAIYRPGARFAFVYDLAGDTRRYFEPSGRVEYEINDLGFRGPPTERNKPEGWFRVVCLGDSITFGEGVRYEDTYPARLEELLNEADSSRTTEVINAGVQAFDTIQEATYFIERQPALRPDVVTLGFFLNDATPYSDTIRQHLERNDEVELSALGRVSRLWEILERKWTARRRREAYFETTRASFSSPKWEQCKATLEVLGRMAHEEGFRIVVVLFPMLWKTDGAYPFEDIHSKIESACEAAHCEFIDLLETLRGRPARDYWVHPTDQHPNEVVHRLAAERIARHLVSREPR